MSKYLGNVSAYAYAVEKGYTGTEEEFAELMASYATVGQTAVTAAQTATTKASEAATSATTATNKASEATTAATTATTKASEASASAQTASTKASEASTSAQTASTKASQASQSASQALTYKTAAESAKTASQTAQGLAETAQTAAETAQGLAEDARDEAQGIVDEISAKAEQIDTLDTRVTAVEGDVSNFKEDLSGKAWDIGSYNRFNKDAVTAGKIIGKTGVITNNADWVISDYIPVTPGMVLYAYEHSVSSFCLFDSNKNIVSTASTSNWANPFTVPSNVYFLRISILSASLNVAYVSTINAYDAYKEIMPFVNEEFSEINTNYKNAIRKSVLFTVSGVLNPDTGAILANANYACTELIPLQGIVTKLQYVVRVTNYIATCVFYRADGSFISSIVSGSSALADVTGHVDTYPANAAYIRFCSNIQNSFNPFLGAYELGDISLVGKAVGVENVIFSEHDEKTNLIDKNSLSLGYINGGTDGSVHFSTTFYVTDFIPLVPGRQYYFNYSYLYRGYCAFYDSNKTYISGYAATTATNYLTSPFTVPAGAAFGRFTIATQANIANAWLCETNQMSEKPADFAEKIITEFVAEKPTDYVGNDICVFTKILCIGDSLTDGFFNENGGSRLIMRNRAYPAKLQAITGIECTNMGYAGYTSVQWYTEYQSEDLSGYDACIIQLGVNDQLQGVSESDMDAALTNIIDKVKAENNGIKIFVATIIPANGYMLTTMRERATMIKDFVESLNDSDVYLIDLWKYGHTDDLLAFDAGHLSAYGYLQLAMDYKAYISYIIRNNPNDFRYVQFVGTNYSYDGSTEMRVISY